MAGMFLFIGFRSLMSFVFVWREVVSLPSVLFEWKTEYNSLLQIKIWNFHVVLKNHKIKKKLQFFDVYKKRSFLEGRISWNGVIQQLELFSFMEKLVLG